MNLFNRVAQVLGHVKDRRYLVTGRGAIGSLYSHWLLGVEV